MMKKLIEVSGLIIVLELLYCITGFPNNDSSHCGELQIKRFLSKRELSSIDPVKPIVCEGKINKLYKLTLNYSVDYIFQFPAATEERPTRITVESGDASVIYPIIVVVEQQKSVLSWELPLVVQTDFASYLYNRTSRTLCPNVWTKNDTKHDEIILIISTRSDINVSLSLKVELQEDFSVKLQDPKTTSVTPSEPRYYKFQFYGLTTSATLVVESADYVCMTLSIQNMSCPVNDLERNSNDRGLWETVSSKGGIMLTKEEYPLGLFIVFAVHSNDDDCFGKPSFINNRNKTLTFRLEPSLGSDKYLIAIGAVVVIIFVFCLIVCFTATWLEIRHDNYRQLNNDVPSIQYVPGPYVPVEEQDVQTIAVQGTPVYEEDEDPPKEGSTTCCCWSWSDSDDGNSHFIYVSHLTRRNPALLRSESNLFLWNLLIVALFYSLPVVQLVFTQQKNLNEFGNQDLCYYNFLCTHHLYFMTDFNHIFSNTGYLALGVMFICIVMRREAFRTQNPGFGLPPQYGLYYALGVALIMEGVLSGCYHVCPNKSNFQFDTSFMYVLSTLSMLRMYQSRHADINANAHSTYGVLAIIIFSGMCGILLNSIYFFALFSVFHLLFCFFLTAQIYHFGRWSLDLNVYNRVVMAIKEEYQAGPRNWCKPVYPSRMLLLLLGNMCNWALIAVGWFYPFQDFATYLLTVLIANLFLYLFFYISMKCFYKEKILLQTKVYVLLAMFLWAAASYFFYFKKIISWKLTPAQSRNFNQPCIFLDFYDSHDIWHFLSAGGMFSSFMVLLTLDDDVAYRRTNKIRIF